MLFRSAHEDAHCNTGEFHLVEAVQQLRNEGGSGTGVIQDLAQSEATEVTNEAIGGCWREGERVAPKPPLEDDYRVAGSYCPYQCESALSSCETRIEEGLQARRR